MKIVPAYMDMCEALVPEHTSRTEWEKVRATPGHLINPSKTTAG